MTEKLAVNIITPEKVVYARKADSVRIPGSMGEMELLPGHISLFSITVPGSVVVKRNDKDASFAVGAGFLEVVNDKVMLLVDSAEGSEDIDIDQAKAIIDAAQDKLKELDPEDKEERHAFETELATARAQVEVFQRTNKQQ